MSEWSPKMLIERLCAQAVHAPDATMLHAMESLIGILGLHRPIGTDGSDRDDPCHCCLATEVETLRAQVEQLSDARHVPGPYFWHCPACQELHRVLGGAS